MSAIHPQTSNYQFRFEPFLQSEFHLGLDPDRPVCQFFNGHGGCPLGDQCPNKHVASIFYNKIVCKHWLRGLCKKGDHCEFLHEYNLRKMPECLFFSKNGFCTQTPECQYSHIDPQSKVPECLNYSAGFCPEGPNCKMRHIKRIVCQNYITGFCPDGPDCDLAHPKFEMLPDKLRIRPDRRSGNKGKTKSILELQIEQEREKLRLQDEASGKK